MQTIILIPKGDDIMDLWNEFLKSGKISDYLKYKLSEEGSFNDNVEWSDNKRE